MKKRLTVSMVILVMLLTSFSMVGQAANTSDTTYSINVNPKSGSFKGVHSRDKQNATKVYVHINSAPDRYTQVQTMGNRNTTKFNNETKGTTATVVRGVKSSITNFCYERRSPDHTYVLARIRLRSGTQNSGWVKGVWSPDSTKNYTIVN